MLFSMKLRGLEWYGIVGFNVPLDTLCVILEMILRVT